MWMVIVVIVTAITLRRTLKRRLWFNMDLQGTLDWFSMLWLIIVFAISVVAITYYFVYCTPAYLISFLTYRLYP